MTLVGNPNYPEYTDAERHQWQELYNQRRERMREYYGLVPLKHRLKFHIKLAKAIEAEIVYKQIIEGAKQ